MDAVASPAGVSLEPGFVSLAALPPGTTGHVVGVGGRAGALSALERRLLEFGFVSGEEIEILAEARPGGIPSSCASARRRSRCDGARRRASG